jgi:DNA helicase-2/ATP-dependent DNA helicase PcrA
MPSNSVIISAAGGGKTTRIVGDALGGGSERSVLLTYTENNVGELKKRFYELNSTIPKNVEVWSWYTFLLREMARPYQNTMFNGRIRGIFWVEGRSGTFADATQISRYYLHGDELIYSDKLARFVYECDRASGGAVIKRLEQRFDQLYIDEIQDMAGWDIEVIELLLRSTISVTLVGDHRQATFRTNNAAKNSGYGGINIVKKFREWQKAKLCSLIYGLETHRCNQHIADIADAFFPQEPKTKSLNHTITGHDGVFVVSSAEVAKYVEEYHPQVLRLDVRTECHGYPAMNFGESKGLTFDRVLIFPHKLGQKWLSTGDPSHVEKSASKMYVGVSRARYSVAFVHDGAVKVPGMVAYNLKNSGEDPLEVTGSGFGRDSL